MKLLACTETVTLVRHVQTDTTDTYTCETIQGVSWFEKTGDTLSAAGGESPKTEIVVRIPADKAPATLPKAGDYMVKGVLQPVIIAPGYSIPFTPDFWRGRESFRIAKVGNNLRCFLPHVVVRSA